MSTSTKVPAQLKKPTSSIPSPAALAAYQTIDPQLPRMIVDGAIHRDRNSFLYALTGQLVGGAISLSLIGGFIYLVMHNHATEAAELLGAGAIGIVTGFRLTRL